ncbi:ATP-binding protein [Fervidobacterium thailandense]|uniref:histidine kinase n=1 Tax=Fervidobacterium thailandense TaxID=1008305 RepID=A0A1E3G0U0_9BACT|nr:ATP-binding protein [Fervidobacterium thailandense]ODN29847.1 histidine kinase [Fervidobacterium thailandense]
MGARKICSALLNIFESEFRDEFSKEITAELCGVLGAERVSLCLLEKSKGIYRVISGNLLPLFSKVPIMLVPKDHDGVVPVEIDGPSGREKVHGTILKRQINGSEEITGLLLFDKYQCTDEQLAKLVEDLEYFLWIIPRYEHSKTYLEKYRSLWILTRIFEESRTVEELLKEFMFAVGEILEAERTYFVREIHDGFEVKSLGVEREITLHSRFVPREEVDHATLKYLRGGDKMVYKPTGLENLLGSVVKSAIFTKAEDGWFVFVNKREKKHYVQVKSFDSLDFEMARDATRRYVLARGRIEFDIKLRHEVEKLKQLQENYEELIETQREQIRKMNAVHYISQAMRTMYSVKNVYKTLLLGLTSGRLLGYNRALLLVYDEKRDVLVGRMWLGPEGENVEEEWRKANMRAMRYADVVQYLREEAMTLEISNKLTEMIENKIFPYKAHPILERCVLRKKIFIANEKVLDAMGLGAADLVSLLGTKDFAVIPLVGRDSTFGVVIVDNFYTKRPIKESDVEILKLISDSAGLAIETAINYEELRNKTLSLERQKSTIEFLREFSESVLQNMSSAIIVLDREGRITEWNKKAELYFGRTKEQVIGSELDTLSVEFEDLKELSFQCLRIKEEITLSNYLINVGAKERYFDIKITPFWDSEKIMLRGVIITLDDVTERVNLEKERKKQEKLAALGEMAARVAHELRNPVSVLGGFIKRLEKNQGDEEARKRYIKIISEEILRLENIVNEILDFSREPRSLEFRLFDINKLIKDVYLLLEEKIKEKNILFMFETDKEQMFVYGEAARLKQVAINLLQNAIEATPVGGKILVETRERLDRIVFSVWNEGTPIPKDIAEKLFVPFFTTKVHGTGLGLAICKKIVEDEHGGKIYHESTEDGNKFVVELEKPSELQGVDLEK